MFCPKCGKSVENGSQFCVNCGNALPAETPMQPQYQQPQYQQPIAQALPMKWYKFLIYVGLFAGALLNAGNGISLLTGAVYGANAELVYNYVDGLKAVDMLVGLCLLAVAALSLFTRFRLSGYRKNALTMLNATYLSVAAVQVIYIIGAVVVCPSELSQYLDFSSTIASIAVSISMIFYNTKYFKERAHLFVN